MDGIKLSASLQINEEEVLVDFTLENARQESVFVTDVNIEVSPDGPSFTTHHLFTLCHPGDVAALSCYLLPLPEGVLWNTPPVAYVTKVAPGERYRGLLGATRPLRTLDVSDRWSQPQAPSSEEVLCQALRFDLGVIPEGSSSPEPFTLEGRQVWTIGADRLSDQVILSSAAQGGLSLPLIRGV